MGKKKEYMTMASDDGSITEDDDDNYDDNGNGGEEDDNDDVSSINEGDLPPSSQIYSSFKKTTDGMEYAEFSVDTLDAGDITGEEQEEEEEKEETDGQRPQRRRSLSPSQLVSEKSGTTNTKDPLSRSTSALQTRRRATRDERKAKRQQNQSPSAMANRRRACDRGRLERSRNTSRSPGPLSRANRRASQGGSGGPLTKSPTSITGRRTLSASPHGLRRKTAGRSSARTKELSNSLKTLMKDVNEGQDPTTAVSSSNKSLDSSERSAENYSTSPGNSSHSRKKFGSNRRLSARRRSSSPHDVIGSSEAIKALYSGSGHSLLSVSDDDDDDDIESDDDFESDDKEILSEEEKGGGGEVAVNDELTDLQEMFQAAKVTAS